MIKLIENHLDFLLSAVVTSNLPGSVSKNFLLLFRSKETIWTPDSGGDAPEEKGKTDTLKTKIYFSSSLFIRCLYWPLNLHKKIPQLKENEEETLLTGIVLLPVCVSRRCPMDILHCLR